MGYGKLFAYGTDYEREIFEEYRQFSLGHGHDLAPYENYTKQPGQRQPRPRRMYFGGPPTIPHGRR